MRSYASHKRVIRLMRAMCDITRVICIYPSSVLLEVCHEVGFSEPVYSEISEERSMFEFIVKFKRDECSSSGEFNEIEGNGYPFREKADAIESAALSALESVLYHHNVSSGQYNDILFCEYWPLFKHLSENVKGTKTTIMRLSDETISLCSFVDDARLVFASRKSQFGGIFDSSDDIVMVDECESQLRLIHETILAETQEYRDSFRWNYQPNRPSNHDYYEGSYRVKKKMDIRVKCNSTLKLTLNKLCEATCYSSGAISCRCVSEGSYVAEVTIIKLSDPDDHSHPQLSSGECPTASEAEHVVMYRAIRYVCANEGYRVIDLGYNDFSGMQRDIHSLKHVVPTLCEMLVKLKIIVQRGFGRVEILGNKYYRELRRHRLLSELRIPLGDCISEFAYICRSIDGELAKVETYSANRPVLCSLPSVI